MLVRILLNPFGEGGGTPQAQPAAQSAAPAQQSQDPGPQRGSPERLPVSPSSSNSGTRDFTFSGNEPDAGDALGQPQGQANQGQPRQAPAPTDPNLAPGQAAAASEWQSIRDAASGLGYQFPAHIQDDRAALQHMIHQQQQRDYHSQLGQRLAPHAQDLQQFFTQKQAPAQSAAPPRKPWEAPQFDKRWVNLVEQDPASGLYLSKPGVPPEIGQKVTEYAEWRAKFDENPATAMNEMVREAAREEAKALYQQQYQEQQTQGAARDIVRQNAEWFYAKDQSGNPVRDWQGNPTPSPAGLNYLRHLQLARSYGVHDPRAQDALAKQGMQAEWAQQQYKQQQGQQQAASPGAQFATQQTSTNPMAALSPQSRAAQPHNVEDDVDDLQQLKMALRRNVKAAGITDDDFRKQHSFNGE